MEEAHDPKNAEADSIAAVDSKLKKPGQKLKSRVEKAELLHLWKSQKTKAGMISAMYQKLGAMKKVELDAAYSEMMGQHEKMHGKANESVEARRRSCRRL